MGFWENLPGDRLLIDASLWSADLADLRREVQRFDPWVDSYHFDVSDAHFVPGLLFFPDLLAALRPYTTRPFHVHLMVDQPECLVRPFLAAGSDLITVHVENGPAGLLAIDQIRQAGKCVGISVQLETRLEEVIPYLEIVDLVLLMGTPLGIKGQGLAPEATGRIQTLRQLIGARGYTRKVKIFADGGIRQSTVPGLREAGVNGIVPGSLIFGSPDPGETIDWLHSLT
jgi:ribulose-phosphate 3-epimerase